MADMYDVANQGMTSVAPPPAPVMKAARGRLGGMRHIGMLSQLNPNHPIFKKFPGLASFVQARRGGPPMPPGVTPPPSLTNPPSGGNPDPAAGTTPPSSTLDGARPFDPAAGAGVAASPAPYQYQQQADPFNFTEDVSAAGQRHSAIGGPPEDVRQQLLDRYHTAAPQEPALTSRAALSAHVRKTMASRMAQHRKPMLPQRRPMTRPY